MEAWQERWAWQMHQKSIVSSRQLRRMFVNIEDWVSRQTGETNEPFLVCADRSTLSFILAQRGFLRSQGAQTCIRAASGGAVQEQLQRALSLGQSWLVHVLAVLRWCGSVP